MSLILVRLQCTPVNIVVQLGVAENRLRRRCCSAKFTLFGGILARSPLQLQVTPTWASFTAPATASVISFKVEVLPGLHLAFPYLFPHLSGSTSSTSFTFRFVSFRFAICNYEQQPLLMLFGFNFQQLPREESPASSLSPPSSTSAAQSAESLESSFFQLEI